MATSIAVELIQPVNKDKKLLVMKAIKIQSTVCEPVGGDVEKLIQVGQRVEPKDLLEVIK